MEDVTTPVEVKVYEEITKLYNSYIETAMGIEAQEEFEIKEVTIDKLMQTVRNRISNEQRAACGPIASSTPTGVLPVAVTSDFNRQDKRYLYQPSMAILQMVFFLA